MNLNDVPLTRKERKAQRKRAKLMSQNHGRMPATLSDALTGDQSLPLDDQAKEYWLRTSRILFESLFCRHFEFYSASHFTSPITSSDSSQSNGKHIVSCNGRFAFS